MGDKYLEINLFGACIVRSRNKDEFEINGIKHRALFALLATAPFGRRTRTFLQDILWGVACYDSGRQSLRRALSDIKAILGPKYQDLISATNTDVTLDLSKILFIGTAGFGEFLEGMDVQEAGFIQWLRGIRVNPGQVYSLYSPSSQPPVSTLSPTIAILPFQMITGNNGQAALGDWLAEEVCRSLSRSNLLSVISHLSSRSLASPTIDLDQVRQKLKTSYCVTGSVRIFDHNVIVDADFIDSISGRIMWTRQFTGNLRSFLDRSAEGIAQIVEAIGQTIASDALTYVRDRNVSDIENHRLLIAGVGLMHRPTLRDFARSRELIDEAIVRSPNSAETYAWRGKWYILSVFNGWSTNRERDTKIALDCTSRALDMAPDNSFCLTMDGFAHNNLLRRLDIAMSRYDTALSRNPNDALSWLLRGALHAFEDQGELAVLAADKARNLSPVDPFQYYFQSLSATAYLSSGKYAQALDLADRSLILNNRHLSTHRAKITALHFLGRAGEARTAARELMRRQPDFTLANYNDVHPASENSLGRMAVEALNAAGIK